MHGRRKPEAKMSQHHSRELRVEAVREREKERREREIYKPIKCLSTSVGPLEVMTQQPRKIRRRNACR